MNVQYTNSVTDASKTLRETVYNTTEFKCKFIDKLRENIGATETSFTADQFGGWSVNVSVDTDSLNDSCYYIKKVSDTLVSTIHDVNHTISYPEDVMNNITNVIMTGSNSFVIKL